MSQFREQLLSAQLGYHAPIYPDDLATQLLPPKRQLWPRIVATLIAGAIAAAIVIMLLNQSIVVPQAKKIERKPVDPESSPTIAVLPGLPPLSAPINDNQPVFLPSLPALPSLGDVMGVSDKENREKENQTPRKASGSRESL